MAYDFLNTTTYDQQLKDQEDMMNFISQQTASQDQIPTITDSDLVEIMGSEDDAPDQMEEVSDSEGDKMATDTFDYENEQDDNTDMQLMSFLFAEDESNNNEGAGSLLNAENTLSENTDLDWLKTKTDAVKLQNLGAPLSRYLNTLPSSLRNQLVATSGNDQEHVQNSDHYSNRAVDLRYNDEAYKYMLNDPNRKQYGVKMLNPNHGTAPHIHLDYQYGGSTLMANTPAQKHKGLNDMQYDSAVLNLTGKNTIRGLDNYQPVAVTDGSKYQILKGPNDTAKFNGKVYEQRLK
jgi:hypothetical protein